METCEPSPDTSLPPAQDVPFVCNPHNATKSRTITLVLAGIVIAALSLWPILRLELAKLKAISKFTSDDRRALDCAPSSSVVTIPNHTAASGYLFVQPPGCEVGLPDSEFQRDSTHPVVLTNGDWLVACFGTLDKTNYTTLEHETGRTNVLDFISGAYQATVTGISKQRSMTQLRQYSALLLYKAKTAPVGFDRSWLRFERGDIGGFISGDMSKGNRVAVEIYLKQKDEFLTLLIKRKGPAGDMSDVYHILSELKVNPDTTMDAR